MHILAPFSLKPKENTTLEEEISLPSAMLQHAQPLLAYGAAS